MTVISPYVLQTRTSNRHKTAKFNKSFISHHAENNEEFAHMISEFLEHTSVPGLSQVGSRKSRIWKFSWVFMTLTGLAMAVYQSRNVIQDYYQNSVVQRISYTSPSYLPLPSITICSNIFIDEKSLHKLSTFDSSLLSFLEFDYRDTDYDEAMPKFQSKFRRLSHHMLLKKWNESLKMQLCGSIRKRFGFITLRPDPEYSYVGYEYAEKHGIIHEFHNYAFGCCFTINPGFNFKRNVVLNGHKKELLIQLNMDTSNRIIMSNDFFASVLVHPLSTPPIMGSPEMIEVYPGDYVKITVKRTELDRSARSCVNNEDIKWRKTLALYSDKTPYVYTKLACEETCAQMTLQWSERPVTACLRAESPITAEILRDDPYPTFCDPNLATVSLSRNSNFSCDCPVECKETLLKNSVVSTSGLNWNAYKNMIKFNRTGGMGAESTFLLHQYNKSMIKVMYDSVQMEIIAEENKYSVADFWGIIGGNLGLWVGLCLLSIIEVIELFSSLIKTFCQYQRHVNTK